MSDYKLQEEILRLEMAENMQYYRQIVDLAYKASLDAGITVKDVLKEVSGELLEADKYDWYFAYGNHELICSHEFYAPEEPITFTANCLNGYDFVLVAD